MSEELSREQRSMRHTDKAIEERKRIWLQISDISEAEFDAHMAFQRARQADVPQPGSKALDFELDRLDRERRRNGETIRLSALHGKPVALIFGSYT
jgi:hypothetical protein